ncbi:MAG: hypothetical protein AB1705_11320 [Verrucomicrobiota bacterium]
MNCYAVLQTETAMPDPERVRRAIRGMENITDADAARLSRGAYGILMKRIALEEARLLQRLLQSNGIASEVVILDQLPPVADAKEIRHAELSPASLIIFDPLGRRVPLEWKHIAMLSAGVVKHFGLTATRRDEQVFRPSMTKGLMQTVSSVRHQVEESTQHLLDIYVAGGGMRFRIDGAKFLFKFVLDRPEMSMPEKFAWLIRTLGEHAPQAMLNRGAVAFRDGAATPVEYETLGAWEDESLWLLWQKTSKPG